MVHEVLKNLVLEGRIVTVDALLTQRKAAEDVLDGGGCPRVRGESLLLNQE